MVGGGYRGRVGGAVEYSRRRSFCNDGRAFRRSPTVRMLSDKGGVSHSARDVRFAPLCSTWERLSDMLGSEITVLLLRPLRAISSRCGRFERATSKRRTNISETASCHEATESERKAGG